MAQRYRCSPYKQNLGSRGWIEGLELTSTRSKKPICQYYGGVPYAQPPVGDLRFRKTRRLSADFNYGTESEPGRYDEKCALCPQPEWRWEVDPATWSENCLNLNVWVPEGASARPRAGWPVFVYIHGGFLQFGPPNKEPEIIAQMYEETPFNAIVVMPAYRLNALGFLASYELATEAENSGETAGNMGFWDQRTAIEWTAEHVAAFGGDPSNITVGGYSAGSYSTFHQLSYDLFLPDSQSLIKRAIMWSNGSGIQPKDLDGHQRGFDELCSALEIPPSLPGSEKLSKLRALPVHEIIKVLNDLRHSEFRAHSDGVFVNQKLIESINNGEFGRIMKRRGVRLLNGECRDEHYLYQDWRTPENSFKAVYDRLLADYPDRAVQNLLRLRCPAQQLPQGCTDWQDCFGRIYADLQVHCLERGFHKRLYDSGLEFGKDVFRYRIEWRAKCVDAFWPVEWKVTHDTDNAIWFFGNGWGQGLDDAEKEIIRPFNQIFSDFVSGKDFKWEWCRNDPKLVKRLDSQGNVDVWNDERWHEAQDVWAAVNETATADKKLSAKL